MNFNEFTAFLELSNANLFFAQAIYFKFKLNIKDYFKTFDKADVKYIFQDAFVWSNTDPGLEYWTDIDDAFQIIIKQKLKENFGK